MDFKSILSKRIGIKVIREIINETQGNAENINELYKLLFDNDDITAYQAAWVMCHFSKEDNEWLFKKQTELIDEVLVCSHTGKRRLILCLLEKQPLENNPPRLDFLDFCMERMFKMTEPPGIQMLCIKIAYYLCSAISELLNEFIQTLELIEPELLPPSLKCVRSNVLDKYIRKQNFGYAQLPKRESRKDFTNFTTL